MKHKRSLISIAMATIMLVSLCAVCISTNLSAAQGSSTASVQASSAGTPVAAGTGPAVCEPSSDQLYVFVQGYDHAIWFRVEQLNRPDLPNWGWGGWHSLGGYMTSSPAVVSWGNGRMDVFARGNDGAIWHIWWLNGLWSGWESLGGYILPGTGPAVSSWGAGRLDLFFIGHDNALWHRYFQNWWSGWESFGGYMTSSPGAYSWGPGRIDVFARGNEGALWHIWWQYGWSRWESFSGYILPGTGPAVSSAESWGSYQIYVFVVGAGRDMVERTWTSATGWTDWASLGGSLSASPSAISRYDYALVWVCGSNGYVYQKEYFWNTWYPWSGGMVGPPCQANCDISLDMTTS